MLIIESELFVLEEALCVSKLFATERPHNKAKHNSLRGLDGDFNLIKASLVYRSLTGKP